MGHQGCRQTLLRSTHLRSTCIRNTRLRNICLKEIRLNSIRGIKLFLFGEVRKHFLAEGTDTLSHQIKESRQKEVAETRRGLHKNFLRNTQKFAFNECEQAKRSKGVDLSIQWSIIWRQYTQGDVISRRKDFSHPESLSHTPSNGDGTQTRYYTTSLKESLTPQQHTVHLQSKVWSNKETTQRSNVVGLHLIREELTNSLRHIPRSNARTLNAQKEKAWRMRTATHLQRACTLPSTNAS